MSHDHGGSSTMVMWFHFSEHSTILFKEWQTMTWAEMLGSCFAVAVLAALYEGLKVGRELIDRRMNAAKSTDSNSSLTTNYRGQWIRESILSPSHFLQTGLHFVQLWISLCLMLVFMTYNVYLCLAITTGGAVGYYCFAWAKRRNRFGYDTEMCH